MGALAPETLRSLHKLGVLQRAKGEYGKAAATLKQALDGRRTTLGTQHEETLRAMNDLGNALYDKGRHDGRKIDLDAAHALYAAAFTACHRLLGDRHHLTLLSMNNLGNVVHARALMEPKFIAGRGPNIRRESELHRAAALLRESLDASRSVHGSRHLETLISASNLGSALRSLGGERAALGRADTAVENEAAVILQDAVEGLADAYAGDLERRPRMRDAVRLGLEDVLSSDVGAGEMGGATTGGLNTSSQTPSHRTASIQGPFEATGTFLLGLLAAGTATRDDQLRESLAGWKRTFTM